MNDKLKKSAKYLPGQTWSNEREKREIIEIDKYDITYTVNGVESKLSRNAFGNWGRRTNATLTNE